MARRSILGSILAVALVATVMRSLCFTAGAGAPALRGVSQGSFAGEPALTTSSSVVAMNALPEPRPNDNMLPVDLNRTSLYWGLLTILILAILFSSFLFN
eukprot:CAMPEP_0178453774 /NCGR_PEP_ID=MMETSP0689_2-20121128/44989_1 /TAXON_ID=160604 /ORGANISM="Amphidinium massartii, Strain CS-259" /LENGTH=99 /DNA_ID=CAMNT_0020079633 /DNA_START=31 /DNA_END=330 /DNA_ORIENTATION=-